MSGFTTILLLAIVTLAGLFYKMQNYTKTEQEKEFLWKIIQIATVLLVTGFLANEIVQPLFSPRVESMEITPLYIQSKDSDGTTEYYGIFEVKYKILPPLLGGNKTLTLRIPGEVSEDIEINLHLQEENPYYSVIGLGERRQSISSSEMGGKFDILLKANSYDLKEVEMNFIIAEKLDIIGNHMGISGRYWWNSATIQPSSTVKDIYDKSYRETVGYGIKMPTETPFKFEIIKIRNLAELEIRGLKVSLPGDTICHKDLEIEKRGQISIELNSGETKTFLIVTKETQMPYPYYHRVVFKGQEGNCIIYNQIYKKLLKEM